MDSDQPSDDNVSKFHYKTTEVRLEFEIDNFIHRMESMEQNQYLWSKTFSFKAGEGSYPLAIKVYPAGDKRKDENGENIEELKDYIAIYIYNRSTDQKIEARYVIGVTANGKSFNLRSWPKSILRKNHGWGCNRLLKKEDLKNGSRFIENGRLKIFAKVTIYLKDEVSEVDNQTLSGHIMDSLPNYYNCIEQTDLTDLKINLKKSKFVDEKGDYGKESEDGHKLEFKCHKLILALRSTVFKAMFHHEPEIKEVQIEDCHPKAIDITLKYMYNHMDIDEKQLEKYVAETIYVADKYNLPGLKNKCEEMVVRTLHVDKATEMAEVAFLHGSKGLKRKVTKYILEDRNYKKICTQESWKKLMENNPKIFIDLFKAYKEVK